MHFRKFKANNIFTGREFLDQDQVVVADNEGIIKDIVTIKDAGDGIEVFDGILTPGFVNAHCHLELSHMKNVVPPGTGLVQFVQQVMTKRGATDEEKLDAMQKAEQELYQTGTVAVGDICNTADSIPTKQKSKIYWHNFIEVSGFVDAVADKRLDDAKLVLAKFKSEKSKAKSNATLAPHAPYSVSKTLFQQLNNETIQQLTTIHSQECIAEEELYMNKTGGFLELYKNFGIDISGFEPTGKSSLQSFLSYFTNRQSIISVHNTFAKKADIDFANSKLTTQNLELFFCICINANKYIEQTIPPLELLKNGGFDMVIGTDSYASNWQLNMVEEMKTIQKDASIRLKDILTWATINGAKALQIADDFGSFDKGKKPGIILIDAINDLQLSPQSSAKRIL
ncbi:MAG TPA: amidohydrolase family protein [Ferruginibacter sp.]|jgi:cytosine/adenosine deaminase-related metal-dependent hydrolase|nr:amidohydrolase family protein [Ferruginibacter sp.]